MSVGSKILATGRLLEPAITEQKTLDTKEIGTEESGKIIDNIPMCLHWLSSEGIILWANKMELETLGYNAEEFVGHNIEKFVVSMSELYEMIEMMSSGKRCENLPLNLYAKDGSTVSISYCSTISWNQGAIKQYNMMGTPPEPVIATWNGIYPIANAHSITPSNYRSPTTGLSRDVADVPDRQDELRNFERTVQNYAQYNPQASPLIQYLFNICRLC